MKPSNLRINNSAAKHRQAGFTLVEIIVTIVVAAILAAMFYSYFGMSITQSGAPVARMGSALNLQEVMENINSDYRANYSTDLSALKARVDTPGSYGDQYTVVESTFIHYDPSCTDPCPEIDDGANPTHLLKVIIKNNSTGETLTTLFSQPEVP